MKTRLPDEPLTQSPEAEVRTQGNGTVSAPLVDAAPVPPTTMPVRPSYGAADVVWFLPRQIERILFPKILDRYVLGELLMPMGFGWALFILLVVFSFYLPKLAPIAARGVPLSWIGEMLWLRVVLTSVICLPMAMLLSSLMAFGRLSGDSELIAMQAAGIRNLRVIWLAGLIGIIVSGAGIGLNEYILPPAGRRLHAIEDQVKLRLGTQALGLSDQNAFIIKDMEHGRLARLVVARKYEDPHDDQPAILRDVTYIEYDINNGHVRDVVEAKRAEFAGIDQKNSKVRWWHFIDATTQMMSSVTGNNQWKIHSDSSVLKLNKSPDEVVRDQKDASDMTYRELKAYIATLKRQTGGSGGRREIRELSVALEQKISVPFAALVLALIGAPLGIRRQRSTAAVGTGLSILIITAYYIGMSALSVFGQNGQITPLTAAWGCNVAGLLLGLYLTWRSS